MQALVTDTPIAVIGAGAMGSGIAQVAAQSGHRVYLLDQRTGAAEAGRQNVAKQLQRRVDKGKLKQSSLDSLLERIIPISDFDELAGAGLVIEAIIENIEAKQKLFTELESICAKQAILATNTSSLSVTALGASMEHPERLVGMHFFNPAPLMALVEVVKGLATSEDVVQCVYATAIQWGKKPVIATSTPGFIVNRVARPFYAESLRLLYEQATDSATLDALIREAGGFRMGPFELTDLIGHDVNYAVTTSVFNAYYQDTRFLPSLVQKDLVDAGRLGRKSGQGFYHYTEGAQKPQPATAETAHTEEDTLIVEGSAGPLAPLVARLRNHGCKVVERDGPGRLLFGAAVLALTDGRMATERAAEDACNNLILLDLAFDYTQANRLAITAAEQASPRAINDACALLQKADIAVSHIADRPGVVIMRTVAMLANEAADAYLHGVASLDDIDLAMKAGLNYPEGPLCWSDSLGLSLVHTVLTNMQQSYGEDRYRPSLLLRKNRFAEKGFYS